MPVDELPVAVNAPVDVGNPQGHVMPRAEDGPGAVRYQGGPVAAAVDYAIAGDVAEVPVIGAQPGTTSIRVICHTLT